MDTISPLPARNPARTPRVRVGAARGAATGQGCGRAAGPRKECHIFLHGGDSVVLMECASQDLRTTKTYRRCGAPGPGLRSRPTRRISKNCS